MTADQYIKKYDENPTLGQLINTLGIGTAITVEDSYGHLVLDFPSYSVANLSDYLDPRDVSLLDYEVQFFEAGQGLIHAVLWEHYEPTYDDFDEDDGYYEE